MNAYQPPSPTRENRLRLGHLYGGSVRYQPGETLGHRLLSDYELVLLIEGQARYECNAEPHELKPGHIVLARPGFRERYVWDRHVTTRHAYFHLGIQAIPHDWPEPDSWPVVHKQPDLAAQGLFQSVLKRSQRRHEPLAGAPPIVDTHLVEVLIELLLDQPASDAAPDDRERPLPVARALKYMRHVLEEEPQKAITLDELAVKAGLSPKHLCRAFKQTVGRPPMATLRLLRLQLGVALLVRSSLPVKEIAAQCGFRDPLHFSRCFSTAFGRSPRAVREDLSQGIAPPQNPLPVDLTPRIHW
ncbi:MAG: AraC family transcriptional regulator [Planctomycetota bacterium]